jgi:hypothetical protein
VKRSLLAIALAAASACTPEPPPDPPPPGEERIEIGVMRGDAFVALSDGDDVDLIAGAQGGFHVELAARVEGMVGEVEVERVARRADTQALVARSAFSSSVMPDGLLDRALPVFLCPAPVGVSIADETLDVTYTIGDAIGTIAFQPRCPSGDDFCDTICRR